MIETEENTIEARQYLFGELDEAARDALEERLFVDEDFALALDAAEHDLIDEYVRGELGGAERRKFEEKYLTSAARREKVGAAAILQRELFAEKAAPAAAAPIAGPTLWTVFADLFRAPRLAFAGGLAVMLLLLAFGGWLWLKSARPSDVAIENETNRAVPTPAPSAPAPPANASPGPAPLDDAAPTDRRAPDGKTRPDAAPTGKSGKSGKSRATRNAAAARAARFRRHFAASLRSGERPVLVVPPAAETVQLRVVHDNEQPFVKYRAEIRDQNGDLVWSREIPVSAATLARPLVLNIRRAALAEGAYELTLSGMTNDRRLEEIKFYNFTVRKK